MMDEKELRHLAHLARKSLDPGLVTDETGAKISAGACLHASLLVLILLKRFGRCNCTVRGGSGQAATGARDVNGVWNGVISVSVQKLPPSIER